MLTMITNISCWLPTEFRESTHLMAVVNLADFFFLTSVLCNSNVGILRNRAVNLKGFVSLKGAHVSGAARFVLGGDWGWMGGFSDIVMKERTSMKDEWDYKRAGVGWWEQHCQEVEMPDVFEDWSLAQPGWRKEANLGLEDRRWEEVRLDSCWGQITDGSKQCCLFQKFKCVFQYKSNPCSSKQLVSNRKIGNVKLNIQNSNTPMTMVLSWGIFLRFLSTFVWMCYVVEGSRAGNWYTNNHNQAALSTPLLQTRINTERWSTVAFPLISLSYAAHPYPPPQAGRGEALSKMLLLRVCVFLFTAISPAPSTGSGPESTTVTMCWMNESILSKAPECKWHLPGLLLTCSHVLRGTVDDYPYSPWELFPFFPNSISSLPWPPGQGCLEEG